MTIKLMPVIPLPALCIKNIDGSENDYWSKAQVASIQKIAFNAGEQEAADVPRLREKENAWLAVCGDPAARELEEVMMQCSCEGCSFCLKCLAMNTLPPSTRQMLKGFEEAELITARMLAAERAMPPKLGMLNDTVITAGVDVAEDRIEITVRDWTSKFYPVSALQDPARFATMQQFVNAPMGKPWSEPPRSSVMQPHHVDFLG